MTIWHWVRHGPTHEKNFVGWRDVPADLSAHNQIARLCAFLPADAMVVSSDLQRAVRTADAICGKRRRLDHFSGLREFNFGSWDNKSFTTVADAHPELSRRYWETPGDVAPPGGESWNTVSARVQTCVDHIARLHVPAHIIAVAHIGVILTQVQRALGCSAAEAIGNKIDNLSVTSVDLSGTQPDLIRINHSP